MSKPIGDESAAVFAASFYRAIAFGRSVKEAFELGKAALLLEGIPEAQTPRLDIREGVDAAASTLVGPKSGPVEDVVPPQTARTANSTRPLPQMDRLTLVRTLAALSPSDFDLLVAAIPNAAPQVSRHGTVSEKAAELVRWAESPPGCGLPAIERVLAGF
jgi:hypothetical protein